MTSTLLSSLQLIFMEAFVLLESALEKGVVEMRNVISNEIAFNNGCSAMFLLASSSDHAFQELIQARPSPWSCQLDVFQPLSLLVAEHNCIRDAVQRIVGAGLTDTHLGTRGDNIVLVITW